MGNSPDINAELNLKIIELSNKLSKLEIEIAERRPISEVIRYMTYLFAAVAFLLGVFGFNEVSDIEDGIAADLQSAIPGIIDEKIAQRAKSFESALSFIESIEKRKKEVDEAYKVFLARAEELNRIKFASSSIDIEAEFVRIGFEADERKRHEPDFTRDDPFSGTYLEEAWRLGVFKRMREIVADAEGLRNVSPDNIFNIAQTMRGLGNSGVVGELVDRLPVDEKNPAIVAMRLATQVDRTRGSDRDESYKRLLGMLVNLNEQSPQIVISEAWNATESLRRYSEFISALEEAEIELTKSEKSVPSFLNVILARTYLRRGYTGDKFKAKENFERAKSRLSSESPMNQWSMDTEIEVKRLGEFLDP